MPYRSGIYCFNPVAFSTNASKCILWKTLFLSPVALCKPDHSGGKLRKISAGWNKKSYYNWGITVNAPVENRSVLSIIHKIFMLHPCTIWWRHVYIASTYPCKKYFPCDIISFDWNMTTTKEFVSKFSYKQRELINIFEETYSHLSSPYVIYATAALITMFNLSQIRDSDR